MNLRRKILNPFLLLGLLAVIGIVAGLGLTGTFDSEDTDPEPIRSSSSSPASAASEDEDDRDSFRQPILNYRIGIAS